jgi:hypothetical protein
MVEENDKTTKRKYDVSGRHWGRRSAKGQDFVPTEKERERVLLLVGLGWHRRQIAQALEIAPKTLLRHFGGELYAPRNKRAMLESALWQKLWEQVQAGNVSAIKEFRRLLKSDEAPDVSSQELVAAVEPKLGKKERAALDARQPDTSTEIGELMARRQHSAIN